ncbi:MAG: hypothetical protein ACYTGH_14125 [Planctomycetota bacterium]|jgi:hypothetical protein
MLSFIFLVISGVVMMKPLEQYIQEALGVRLSVAPWKKASELPFLLRDAYALHEGTLLGLQCLFVADLRDEAQSPESLRKQLDQVSKYTEAEVIYVRDRMTSYHRRRLVERKISFVVPGNQMYLPLLGLDLREHFRALRSEPKRFSPATQALLIHILLERSYADVTPSQMAEVLGYTAMTMSRAFDELELAGIGVCTHKGRTRMLGFEEEHRGRALWEKSLPFLVSPVGKRVFAAVTDDSLQSRARAGLDALSALSMLAPPPYSVIALDRKAYRSLGQGGEQAQELPDYEPDAVQVEVWNYVPDLLVQSGMVDPLSLYLSLREGDDERIDAALEELLEGVAW